MHVVFLIGLGSAISSLEDWHLELCTEVDSGHFGFDLQAPQDLVIVAALLGGRGIEGDMKVDRNLRAGR